MVTRLKTDYSCQSPLKGMPDYLFRGERYVTLGCTDFSATYRPVSPLSSDAGIHGARVAGTQ